MPLDNWKFDQFEISTNHARLDRDLIVAALRGTYWAGTLPVKAIWTSVENARAYGLYHRKDGGQVGFCRVVTDMTRFAWVSDVFIIDAHKGQGLGKKLMACVVGDPALSAVSRWMLATDDAHGLYAQFAFSPLEEPELSKMMIMRRPKTA